jgi:predicted P-loop ATPase
LRVDWQPPALRHLARLAAKSGFSRDAVAQLVAAAAKRLGFPVVRARQIASSERRKLAPPPAPLPPDAAPEARLVAAAGAPSDGTVNAGGWKTALSTGVGSSLRLNLLGHRIEFSGQELEAEREELLYVAAQETGWKVNKADCYDGTRAAALAYAFHPVAEYLAQVAVDPTLSAFNLDTVAARYLGVGDPLSAAMLRRQLIGAVARIFEPGCPPPGVVVLRGAQGIGKSELWQALAGEFYVASRDGDDGKDQAMAMHRSWFYDLDELDKVTTARQAAGLRSIITAPADTFRLPYARRETTMPRRFVMVASVNGDGFLTDPEGNRRFWVIDCPQQKDSGQFLDGPGIKRDRDAIWKAAVLAYRAGEPWRLSPEQQAASNVRNGAWEAVDEWEGALAGWATRAFTPSGFSLREAIAGAGLRQLDHISKADDMRAAEALKRAGFSRSEGKVARPDGSRMRTWGLAPAQPAQPLPNPFGEVGQVENAGGHCDLPSPAQPAQPFKEVLERERIRGHIWGGVHMSLSYMKEAVEVGQVGRELETASGAADLGCPTSLGQPVQGGAAGQRLPVRAAEGHGQPQIQRTNTEWVEAALAELRLAPAPSATGPVLDWLQFRNAGVSRPQVLATLERLREVEAEEEPQLGLEVVA